MADFTKLNLKDDVEDMAPKHGMTGAESRFARNPLGLEQQGVSYFKFDSGFRLPFGHRHGEQEEIYVVLEGGARFKVEDEIVDMRTFDALRIDNKTPRSFEAGPEGAELRVVGAPNTGPGDADVVQAWWGD